MAEFLSCVKNVSTEFFLNLPIHYLKVKKGFNAKKSGVTKLVCEINWIECKCSSILIHHCYHSNRRNTLFIDSTLVSFFSEICIGSF